MDLYLLLTLLTALIGVPGAILSAWYLWEKLQRYLNDKQLRKDEQS